MSAPLRTKNRFISSRHFLSAACWRAPRAGFLIWPAAWVEVGLEPSLEVRINRLSMGWGPWRAQVDLGTWTKLLVSGPVDWDRLGVDGYLAWSKRAFGRTWGRIDVERLFRSDPSWRQLVMMGTAHNHYIRVLLARAMISATDASALGVNESLGAVVAGPGGNTSQQSWVASSPEEHAGSMMEGLERLGENLRRRSDDDLEN